MAVKPYLGAIREPSNWKDPEDCGRRPEGDLGLKFVHGYRSERRSSLSYGDAVTEIVYHVGGVGIKYDIDEHSQLFNLEHDDEIVACAVHPLGHTVATGEVGKNPKIVLWDSNSGSTLSVCIGFHQRGVSMLRFTGDGKFVVSIGMDDDHSVAVYGSDPDSNLGKLIASANSSSCCTLNGPPVLKIESAV